MLCFCFVETKKFLIIQLSLIPYYYTPKSMEIDPAYDTGLGHIMIIEVSEQKGLYSGCLAMGYLSSVSITM